MLATHCTGPEVSWWQKFSIYKGYKNRRSYLCWGTSPKKSERVYSSPLVTAQRYLNILQNDSRVRTQADLAKEEGVSRVRITQIMNLLKLAPDIKEHLLSLEDQKSIHFFTEHRLRPLAQIEDPKHQLQEFRILMSQVEN